MTTHTPATAPPLRPRSSRLRTLLLLDAAASGLNAIAYLAAAPLLADLFSLDAVLLRWIGAFLVLYAAAVWFVGSRPDIHRGGAGLVVAANTVWVLGSVVVAATQWGTPSAAGTAWIILQAVLVAGFAVLQFAALRSVRRDV